MSPTAERRALQVVAALACLVPLIVGIQSVLRGVAYLKGAPVPVPPDLDSHFRYVSGIFLGLGIGFAYAIVRIERRTAIFRLLGMMVVLGGCARLLSLADVGVPSRGHVFGLFMELSVVPLLMLWQRRVARRCAREGSKDPVSAVHVEMRPSKHASVGVFDCGLDFARPPLDMNGCSPELTSPLAAGGAGDGDEFLAQRDRPG